MVSGPSPPPPTIQKWRAPRTPRPPEAPPPAPRPPPEFLIDHKAPRLEHPLTPIPATNIPRLIVIFGDHEFRPAPLSLQNKPLANRKLSALKTPRAKAQHTQAPLRLPSHHVAGNLRRPLVLNTGAGHDGARLPHLRRISTRRRGHCHQHPIRPSAQAGTIGIVTTEPVEDGRSATTALPRREFRSPPCSSNF